MRNIHVLPIDDAIPHVRDDDCPCETRVEWSDACDRKIVIHYSYDNREATEAYD
jgi:hypothetical protein